MKKLFFLFFIFILFLFTSVTGYASDLPEISAKSAVVISADTGEIVFEKNPYQKLPMASTTKIMTSILALEYGASEQYFTVTDEMVSVEGSSIGLLPNDMISLKTLVKGMLLESGNDAANSVAYIVGGTLSDFVALMNYKANEIGMNSTSFETPSGLDGENHYSTAYDMAILGAYAINNPVFKEICSSKELVVYYGNEPYRRLFTNNNKLLNEYDGAFGIKTGFTKKSGRCLVSAVERDDKTLIAVTLNAADDWNDHMKMYDYSFEKVYSVDLSCDLQELSLAVVGGKEDKVSLNISDQPTITTIDKNFDYEYKIFLKPFEYAPINKGDILGFIEFYDESGKLIATTDICADSSVGVEIKNIEKESIFEKIINLFR